MKKVISLFWLSLFCSLSALWAQQDKIWTLEECISFALEQNITVRKSYLNNQSLEHQAAQARAQRLPSLNASLGQSFNWSRSDGTNPEENDIVFNNGSNYGINSQVNLFSGSRLSR
jgi:outer membrane protein